MAVPHAASRRGQVVSSRYDVYSLYSEPSEQRNVKMIVESLLDNGGILDNANKCISIALWGILPLLAALRSNIFAVPPCLRLAQRFSTGEVWWVKAGFYRRANVTNAEPPCVHLPRLCN